MPGDLLALLTAAALGLRHALDPDHLVAVADLAAERDRGGAAAAARVGFLWGVGHAVSLSLAGLGMVALGWAARLLRGGLLEPAVGLAILALAIRLFLLQRRAAPTSVPAPVRGRRGALAFATGLLHGLAGSGAVTVALLLLVPRAVAIPALLLFAGMTCVSMTLCALALGAGFGRLGEGGVGRRGRRALAAASMLFGIGYAALA